MVYPLCRLPCNTDHTVVHKNTNAYNLIKSWRLMMGKWQEKLKLYYN